MLPRVVYNERSTHRTLHRSRHAHTPYIKQMNPNRGCAISAFRHGWILLFGGLGGLGPFWSTSGVLLLQYSGHIHLPFQIIFLGGNTVLNAPSPSRTRAWAWQSTSLGVQSLRSHASNLPPWIYKATMPICAFHL